jgi:hypothetical protein
METAKERFSAFMVIFLKFLVHCGVLLVFYDLVADEAAGFGAANGVAAGHCAAAHHAEHRCRGNGAD